MMRPVIVLITVFAQVLSIALCDDNQPQFLPGGMVAPQQFFLPGSPDQSQLPPCPCCGPPSEGQSPPIIPCIPDSVPPKPCPCCKPPTGALALLLDMVANMLNLPKGSLSKLPLCCASDVTLPPQLSAITAPLSSIAASGSQGQLSQAQILALIRLLRTPQAVAQTIKITPNVPFFPSQNPNSLPELSPPTGNFPVPNFPPQIPENSPFPNYPQCITHRLEQSIRPVVDECVRNVPVYQNTISHQEEQTIRNVPVVEKTLTNQEEHVVRQVPVVRRITRPVVETRTRHVPVIRKRIRTVVEPYTSHVPILEKFTRPVEEIFITSVPVMERRCRPVYTQTVRQVPVTEKRLRPFVQSQITQVPVKQKVVKHIVEHRVKPYLGPCDPCSNPAPQQYFPFPPTFLNVPNTPSYPC